MIINNQTQVVIIVIHYYKKIGIVSLNWPPITLDTNSKGKEKHLRNTLSLDEIDQLLPHDKKFSNRIFFYYWVLCVKYKCILLYI